MNVLIINGHPRKKSFSTAIAKAYCEGAHEAGAKVEQLTLSEMDFNPNVIKRKSEQQVEPDIIYARNMIMWASHILFVYPTWWGTMPALLKGFVDRVFTEGFAFSEIEGGTGYEPLLQGRTAQIITTMDTPYLVYQLIYRAPGHNAMRRAILEFCGFELAKTLSLGPIRGSSDEQRRKWLDQVRYEGLKLRNGALPISKRLSVKVFAWLKAIRLQFYPMTAVAYAAGAYAAVQSGHNFHSSFFWHGYAWLFFLEVATVLINEYVDYGTDKNNQYFSPFTGGSRVIVNKALSFKEIKWGIIITLAISFILLFTLLPKLTGNHTEVILTSIILTVLALGYTAPPLKFSYHTLGELTVGITHSFAVIISGYLFIGGNVFDSYPWALGLPLFLAILPSITIAGIPDHDGDLQADKQTLAVQFGRKAASQIALSFTWLSVACILAFNFFDIHSSAFSHVIYFALPHAILLTYLLNRYNANPNPPKRIDGIIVAALTYLVWFALIPLINLA